MGVLRLDLRQPGWWWPNEQVGEYVSRRLRITNNRPFPLCGGLTVRMSTLSESKSNVIWRQFLRDRGAAGELPRHGRLRPAN